MRKEKKNWVVRLMAVALMFALVSTCLMSGTLAKYTTSTSGMDSARVAKWGVGATNTIDNLFDHEDTGVQGILLAPGTTGSKDFQIIADGAPEVAYSITFDTAVSYTVDGDEAAWPNDYYPVEFRLNDGAWGTLSDLEASLKAMSGDISGTKNYAPGTAIPAELLDVNTIEWRWEFDGDDVKDTALGDFAASEGELGVSVSVAITVTQLDTF